MLNARDQGQKMLFQYVYKMCMDIWEPNTKEQVQKIDRDTDCPKMSRSEYLRMVNDTKNFLLFYCIMDPYYKMTIFVEGLAPWALRYVYRTSIFYENKSSFEPCNWYQIKTARNGQTWDSC